MLHFEHAKFVATVIFAVALHSTNSFFIRQLTQIPRCIFPHFCVYSDGRWVDGCTCNAESLLSRPLFHLSLKKCSSQVPVRSILGILGYVSRFADSPFIISRICSLLVFARYPTGEQYELSSTVHR